jgi:hypothetical protein
MLNSVAALSAAASLLAPMSDVPPWYDPSYIPPPDKVTVQVATVNGSGCPKDTVAVALSPDKTAFTVTYSNYIAQVGPEAKPTDNRKNCQINMKVYVPQGFTYGIVKVDYRGYQELQRGANGRLVAGYYFQGNSSTDRRTHNFKGEGTGDNWTETDATEFAQVVWAPCGEQRNFNINTEVRVDRGSSDKKDTSYVTMDSTDGDLHTQYHWGWKRC